AFAGFVSIGAGFGVFREILPFADFNGDGKPDFAGVAGGDLWMHRNVSTPGTISFAASGAAVSGGWGTVSRFAAADADVDGKADVVGYNGGDQLMIWRSTGTATSFNFAGYAAFGTTWSNFNRLLTTAATN
ncbi:VCBS repeat-containing protein, partial [Actinoplanes sp. NPDC023801]|uniref:FG-GAP repeat domain-containing protein n=1 Tax=Actinoplanes sp. NPDC023801 TaxID=3154595 RepID=UPI0033E40643